MKSMQAIRSPFEELNDLRTQMSRLIESESTHAWSPVVDVSENEREVVVEAELPGMKKDEIDIQWNDGTLVLSGERKIEHAAEPGARFHRMERQYGAWRRAFQFEIPIDASRVSADYQNGVLTIRLPKSEAAKPRRIAIHHVD